MSILLQIAERALNRPLLLHPDKLPIVLDVLNGRIPIEAPAGMIEAARKVIADLPADAQATMFGPNPSASRFVGSNVDRDEISGRSQTLPYRRTSQGVAVIPVIGSLINRGAWLGSYSGETSYEGLKFQIGFAADDPKTTAILLDIDSPGGEAVGAFEAAAAIFAASQKKPVTAIVNGMAASAAYALASAANKIVVGPTSVTGSIGVVMLHADYSGKLAKEGIKPTLIFAGAHKVDGHPFAALPDAVKSDLQAEIDQFYALFVKTVAIGRGGAVSEKQIRATEARTYIGADAVTMGLADDVGTFETALADLNRAQIGQSTTTRRSITMTTKTADARSELTNGDVDAKVATAKTEGHAAGVAEGKTAAAADATAAAATAKAEGVKEGAAASIARVSAITSLPEAAGREAAALKMALTTDMSADAVKGVLATLPAAVAGVSGKRSSDSSIGLIVDPTGAPKANGDVLSAADIAKAVGGK